jgi:hypothetical protein
MTETKLHNFSQKYESFSVAVDESSDVVDTAQLAIFIRGVYINFNIRKELSALCSRKGSITGTELYEQVTRVIEKFNLNLNKLQGITTYAALAMVGKKNGLTALIMKKWRNGQGKLHIWHCVIASHISNLSVQKQ